MAQLNLTSLALEQIAAGNMSIASLASQVKPNGRMSYGSQWATMRKLGQGRYLVENGEGDKTIDSMEVSSGMEAKIMVVDVLVQGIKTAEVEEQPEPEQKPAPRRR